MAPSIDPRARVRRLLGLSSVLATVVAAALAAPASAAPPTSAFYVDVTPTASFAGGYAQAPSASGPYSIELLRGGAAIASNSGASKYQSVDYPGTLLPGDIVRFSTGDGSSSVVFDGTPTIDSGACAGSRTIAGTLASGASLMWVGSATSSGSAGGSPAKAVQSGTAYTAVFSDPLVAGDTVVVSADRTHGAVSLWVTRELPVTSCPKPSGGGQAGGGSTSTGGGSPPSNPPAGNPSLSAQILTALQAALGQQGTLLSSADPITIAKAGFVNIPFAFIVPGSVTFTWQVALLHGKAASTARRKAKKTVVTIASGTGRSTTAGKGKVRLKLTPAGRRLLRTAKAVQVTMTARFLPASGGPAQQSATRFTLHRKATHPKGKRKKH